MNAMMKALILTVVIVGILIVVMTFFGGDDLPTIPDDPDMTSESTDDPTGWERSGREIAVREVKVYDLVGSARDEGGTPLPSVTVFVSRIDSIPGTTSPERVDQQNTGADGKFTVEGLTAGKYRFDGSLAGYQSARVVVIVIEGEAVPTVELVLSTGLSIRGTVRDPIGKPIAGAEVAAFLERVEVDAPIERRLAVLLQLNEITEENGIVATTDDSGAYQIAGLEVEDYKLQVVARGFSPGERRYISAGSTGVDFELALGGILSGVVEDTTGSPCVAAVIEVFRQSPTDDIIEVIQERAMPPLAFRETDARGAFSFDELGGDSNFRLVARASAHQPRQFPNISVNSGEETSVTIVLNLGQVIRGTVFDPYGAILPGARCKANLMGARAGGPPIDLKDEGIVSNDDGEFIFDTLGEGEFRLVVSYPDYSTHQELHVRPENEAMSIQLTEGGAISGTIFDAGTGQGISGAIVTVNDLADVRKTGVSDSTGRYFVRGITEQRRGVSSVSVEAEGYKRSGNEQIEVIEGRETPGADFFLERNGRIQGIVLNNDGTPLPGVSVSVKRQHSPDTTVVINIAPMVTSGPDGTFEILDVGSGEGAFLEGSHPQYLTSRSTAFDVAPNETIEGVTLTLKVGGALRGIVVDQVGAPLEGVVVAVRDDWLGEVNPESLPKKAYTDAAGQWTIRSLEEGEHTLIAAHPGYLGIERTGLEVQEGHTTGSVEIKLMRGAIAAGVVTDPFGKPIQGARVLAVDTSEGLRKVNTTTDIAGRFRFEELGQYPVELIATHSGYSEVRLREVPVNSENLEIVLESLGSIHGFVHEEDGDPVKAFSVAPRVLEGDREFTRVPARTFQDENGQYFFEGLEPGVYRVVFGAPGYTQEVVENIRVESDRVSEIPNVTLGEGGRIGGGIIDAKTGQPIVGATVTVVGGNRNFLTNALKGPQKGRRDQQTTGRDGSFHFIGLSAVVVNLKVEHRAYISEMISEVDSGITDLTIALGQGGIIEGRVFDDEGVAVAGIQILLAGAVKGHDNRTQTDRKGVFNFGGLPSGAYTIRVTNFGVKGARVDLAKAPSYEVQVRTGGTEFLEIVLERE